MADIQEIVDVTITANTLTVSQQGFGTMLILGVNQAFPERIRYYTNLAGVAQDFSPDSAEYQAAVLGFGQIIRPSQIAIGRVLTNTATTINVSQVLNNFDYTLSINNVPVVFNSGNAATGASIATGLANAINAQTPQYVNATALGGGQIGLAPQGSLGAYGIKLGSNIAINQAVPTQTWTQALDDIENISDDWYALVALTRQTMTQVTTFSGDFNSTSTIIIEVDGEETPSITWTTDQATTMANLVSAINDLPTVSNAVIVPGSSNRAIQITGLNGEATVVSVSVGGTTPPTWTIVAQSDPALAIASWVLARKKIYVTATAEAGTLTSPGTGLAAALKANNNRRSVVLYNAGAAFSYPEAAWLGRMLATQPGAATWMFKNLVGVIADPLSTTQSANARNVNNANTYENIGGIDITRDGITSSGEFIDIIVGIDWLESRIEERVFQSLVSVDKVPYTDAGIAVIESALRAQLDEAVSIGLITDDYQIQVPKAASVSSADKLLRILRNVFFTATLSGAIHRVIINGTVSV